MPDEPGMGGVMSDINIIRGEVRGPMILTQ
jgi:hypothetical protein